MFNTLHSSAKRAAKFGMAVTTLVALSACGHKTVKTEAVESSGFPGPQYFANETTETTNPALQEQEPLSAARTASKARPARRHRLHHKTRAHALARVHKKHSVIRQADKSPATAAARVNTRPSQTPPAPPAPTLLAADSPTDLTTAATRTWNWRYGVAALAVLGLIAATYRVRRHKSARHRRLVYNS
jgi:hypothetical protein